MRHLIWVLAIATGLVGCAPSSDQKQQADQERILLEGTAQVGMPSIKNFREKKLLKDILELRDQANFVTYTYLENQFPKVEPGVTSKGGKLTFLGQTIGYGIPYATQFTNPQKVSDDSTHSVVAQADPNGLFSPAAAEGTWIEMKDPSSDDVKVAYIEPRIITLPFKLPVDK